MRERERETQDGWKQLIDVTTKLSRKIVFKLKWIHVCLNQKRQTMTITFLIIWDILLVDVMLTFDFLRISQSLSLSLSRSLLIIF